jgi:hypothetical protein
MKSPWFKRNGILFIPKTLVGWLFLLVFLVCAVIRFIEIDKQSHSASDTLRPFFFQLLLIWAAYTVFAFLISRAQENKT